MSLFIEYILSFGEEFLCYIDIFAGAAWPAWDFSDEDLEEPGQQCPYDISKHKS